MDDNKPSYKIAVAIIVAIIVMIPLMVIAGAIGFGIWMHATGVADTGRYDGYISSTENNTGHYRIVGAWESSEGKYDLKFVFYENRTFEHTCAFKNDPMTFLYQNGTWDIYENGTWERSNGIYSLTVKNEGMTADSASPGNFYAGDYCIDRGVLIDYPKNSIAYHRISA